MAASTIAVNLSGVTGNVYAQAGMTTVYTNVPQNDTVNILVGSEVAAVQLTNPNYTTDTTTGFHVLQNIEVQDSYANYKVWSYYGNVTLTNKLTGQVIQFQLTKPLPGANNSGVNVEFLDGALAYTANVSRNGNWTTWITKGDTGTSTWGTNSVATPFTASTALDQTLLGPSGTNTVNQAVNSSDVNDWYGIEPSWFSSEYYLFSKQAQLAAQGVTITIPELEAAITEAGFTPYTHYLAFSTEELTDPNEYFSTLQVLEAQAAVTGLTVAEVQAAFEASGYTNAYDWWAQNGWTNGINPSNDFNDEAYLEAKAMASGLTVAEVQAAFEAAGLTPLAHYLEFGQAEGLEATPVYLDEQVAWQYSTKLGATAGQAIVGSEVSEQFTAVASPLSRTNTLHATDTINGQGGINTLTVDLAQNFAGFSTGKGLTNIQNVQLINADGIARQWTGTGSTGVENYALAGEVNLASLSSIANVVAQDREGALTIGYAAKVTDGKADQLNLTTIDVGTKDSVVTVTAAGIETLQLDTHGVNILNLSGVANAKELVVLGDGVTEITAVGAAVKAVDAAYASGDLTVNLSGATGVTSVVTGTGENHIRADLTANSGQLAKNAVITGNGTLYDELVLTNVGASGTTTVQYAMSGVEGLAFGNINSTTVQYSAKNTTGLKHVELQSDFAGTATVVNLGAVDMEVQLQGSAGSLTIDNAGVVPVSTQASLAASSTSVETSSTDINLVNATSLFVYVDHYTKLDTANGITANKATSVNLAVNGLITDTVITAGAATEIAILTTDKAQSNAVALVAASATSLILEAAGNLDVSGSTLSGVQTLVAEVGSGTFTAGALAAANSVTLSGDGNVALDVLGATGTTNGYGLTVNAADLNGTLTTGALSAGDGYNLTLNLSTLGGEANLSVTGGALTATTGMVSIDASSALAVINVGDINAKDVRIDAGGSLGSFQAGLISASSSVTYVGTELFANSVDIQATGTSLTVALTGGLGNDNIEVDGGVATSKITLTGDLGSGDNVLTLDALSSATVGINLNYAALYNYDTAAVTGSSLADTITAGSGNDTITGGAAADNLSGGNGDNVFQYGNGEFIAAETVTGGTGTDTVLFTADAQTVADSAFTNKTLIEAITTANGTNSITLGVNAAAATSNLTVTGGSGADRVDASAMTKALTIIGNAGNDTLLGGAGNDTIAAGIDLDSITAGAGADLVTLTVDGATDSITQGVADGVASTANTLIAGQAIAAGQSMTFGNGLDVITHFLAGAGGDVLTVDFNTAQSILGQTSSNIGASGYLSGTYANGTFTVAANGAGLDTLIVQVGGGANLANNSNTSMLLLLGVDSAQLADANFGGIVNLTATFAGSVYSITGAASGQLTMNAATGVLNEAANYPLPHFNQATVTSIDFSAVTGGHGAIINVQGATSSVLASVVGTSASDFIIQATEDMGAAQNTVDGGSGTDALQFLSVGVAGVSLTQTAGGGNFITSIEQVRLTSGSAGTVALDGSVVTAVEVYNDSGVDAATVNLGSGAAHSYTNGSGVAVNDVIVGQGGQNVTTASGDDTVSILSVTNYGGLLALGAGANTVVLNSTNIASSTITSAGGSWKINLLGISIVTVGSQHLQSIAGSTAASDIIGAGGILAVDTSAGGLVNYTLDATPATYMIGLGQTQSNSVLMGIDTQNVELGNGNDTVTLLNGTVNYVQLNGGSNSVNVSNGFNVSGTSVAATGGSYNLSLQDGGSAFAATVSADQLTGGGVTTTGAGVITLTLSNQITNYTIDSDIDRLVLANANNSVAIGAVSQSVTGGSGDDTVTVSGMAATGAFALAAGSNTMALGNGAVLSLADISATGGSWNINLADGANVTLRTNNLVGANAASGIIGGVGAASESVAVDTSQDGALTGYTLSSNVNYWDIGVLGNGNNNITLGATGQYVSFGSGNDVVNTINGMGGLLDFGAGANTLRIGTGQNISGASVSVSGGGSYTLQMLNDNVNPFSATVSAAQLTGGLVGRDWPGSTVTITVSNAISGYTIDTDIDRLILADATNLVVIGSASQSVTGGTGNDLVTGGSVGLSGALNGGGGINTLRLGGGVLGAATISNFTTLDITDSQSIAMANAGGALGIANLQMTANDTLTMTTAQNNGFSGAVTTAGNATVAISDSGGTVNALDNINTYQFGANGSTFVVNAGETGVNITAAGGASGMNINVGGLTVTGTYALGDAVDRITATTGANIAGVNGGGVTTASDLTLSGAITMTAAQYSPLANRITASGGSDSITFTTAATGGIGLDSQVETFVFANAGTNSVSTGANGQTLNANALTDGNALTLVGGNSVTVSLVDGDLSAGAASGNLTVNATIGTNVIVTGAGNDTITGGANADNLAGGSGSNIYQFNTNDVAVGEVVSLTGTSDVFSVLTSTNFSNMNSGSAITGLSGVNIDSVVTASFLSAQITGQLLAVNGVAGGANETFAVNASSNAGVAINLANATLTNAVASITGGLGNDTITGSNAAETITGGEGADNLTGGNGTDTFVYAQNATGITLANADTITNFVKNQDLIKTGVDGLNQFSDVDIGTGDASFADFVVYVNSVFNNNPKGVVVSYDAAGSGNAWVAINNNGSSAFDSGDSLIILIGVSNVNQISETDFIA